MRKYVNNYFTSRDVLYSSDYKVLFLQELKRNEEFFQRKSHIISKSGLRVERDEAKVTFQQ